MWMWTLGVMVMASSAACGEQPDQRGRGVPPGGVVDVALLAAAVDEPGAAQDVQVVRQRRPRHVDRLLDLAGGNLAVGPDQEEEDLEPGEMGEGLERLDVLFRGLQPCERERGSLCHVSRYIKTSK